MRGAEGVRKREGETRWRENERGQGWRDGLAEVGSQAWQRAEVVFLVVSVFVVVLGCWHAGS